jgi:2'-5' RNA ligase
MHLTLRFLGEVDRPTATRLADALAQPIAMSPFELALSGIGVFPPSGRPKVLWIGLAAGASELAAVHGEIERRLQPFGFEPEGRPYRGHLTLARFREPASIEVKALVERAAPGEIGRSQVREVVLYESDLSPRGPTYAPLARGSLAGARVGAEDEEGRD